MNKLVILLSALSIGVCFTSCDSNTPDENGNKNGVKNGAITKGVFSVAEGKQVRFSMGNLQYQASTKSWRFASQQYEYIGDDNKNISDTYDGWIDLFGWGTGDNPIKASTEYEGYATFVDWGTNVISNGGNKPNQWRTLTYDEWSYIIEERPNAKMLYGSARIRIDDNTVVVGMILCPDDWSSPKGIAFYSGMTGWTSNDYDITQWTKMEVAGAIFLPASGSRYGSDVNFVQYGGYYWSASPVDTVGASYLFFYSLGTSWYDDYRCYGRAVRLVQDL